MFKLESTWEGYVQRVESAAAILDQASTSLKAQLLSDCSAFLATCRQCRAELRDTAPYDGQVRSDMPGMKRGRKIPSLWATKRRWSCVRWFTFLAVTLTQANAC